mgnify:CR=1 FL=1
MRAGRSSYDADYDEIWDRVVRTFQHHADKGKEVGCTMLWELESLQPFNHPTEIVKMLNDVGHSHFKLMYDTGHFQACSVIGHNQVQPGEVFPNQIEFINMLPAGCIGHMHLCDTTMETSLDMFGKKVDFGEGIIDFDELMPVLAKAYDGEWWAVDSIPMGPMAWKDTYTGVSLAERGSRQARPLGRRCEQQSFTTSRTSASRTCRSLRSATRMCSSRSRPAGSAVRTSSTTWDAVLVGTADGKGPLILGHEFAGRVVARGKDAQGVQGGRPRRGQSHPVELVRRLLPLRKSALRPLGRARCDHERRLCEIRAHEG